MGRDPLSSALQELREGMGLSRTEFAVQLGVGYPTIEKYERRTFSADAPTTWRIAMLADDNERSDLAALFRAKVIREFEGLTAKVALGNLPMLAGVALDDLRLVVARSREPVKEAEAALRYLRWRQAAHPDDVQRVEQEIKGDLMEG